MKTRILRGLLLIAVLLPTGLLTIKCSKMPVHQSRWEGRPGLQKTKFTGFDSESGIRYVVSNDENHLYLSFDTDSRGVLINILRSGARILVDTNFKKKGTAYLLFPRVRRPEAGAQRATGTRGMPGDRSSVRRNINKRLMGMSEGLWVYGDSEIFIDLQLENSDFDGFMRIDTTGFLHYNVAIPFHSIKEGKLDEVAMGIEIDAPASPPQGMYGGGRGQMGAGSGPPGGGVRIPGGTGTYGRPDGQRPDPSSFTADPVKIWFRVLLAEE
jgi:hypothetical protein